MTLPNSHDSGPNQSRVPSETDAEEKGGAALSGWIVRLDNNIKIAFIVVLAMLIGEGIFIYFSPYHSCMREADDPIRCAHGWPQRAG